MADVAPVALELPTFKGRPGWEFTELGSLSLDAFPPVAEGEGGGPLPELLLETPDAETSVVKDLVREEMCSAYPLDPPLAVDVGAGDSWGDAKS